MLRIGNFSRLAQVTIKTLRYYDDVGLLKPAVVDRFTGYRYYALEQLSRLNRILALKDLGLSLEQIAHLLNSDLDAAEIRGMLRLKQGELQQQIADAQARLARLEMRLRQIDMEDKMPDYEVLIKHIEAQQVIRVRRIVPAAEGIRRLLDDVKTALHPHRIKSGGPWIAMYHHAGFRDHDLDIELAIPVETTPPDRIVLSDGSPMSVRVIPEVAVAVTVLLQGSYDQLGSAYRTLDTYLHEHGHNYLGPAREVYLRGPGDTDNPAEYLTEVQYPVGEWSAEMPVDGSELPADWKDENQPSLAFSRRARTALEFAKLEAAALQQPEVGPVHILLGLLRDGDSFAAHVLSNVGITIEQIRALAPRGQSHLTQPRIHESPRQIVSFAGAEARQPGHDYIGTEHLLLALVQRHAEVIQMLGVSPEQVRAAVLETFKR